MIVGDFNRDQRLCENVAKVDPLIQNFTQRSQYSTHIHGGLLDLPCIGYFRSQAFFICKMYEDKKIGN